MSSLHRPAHSPLRGLARAAAAAGFTLAILLLPALSVGSRIGAPPTAGEIERLASALTIEPGRAGPTPLARSFLLATVWPEPPALPADEPGRAAVASQARLAQMGAVLAATLLLYVVVLLARGRLQGLIACAGLLLLPPVAVEGHVLRAEALAVVFVLFAVLVLQCQAAPGPVLRRRRPLHRAAYAAAVAGCASMALGLAVGTLPSAGECLLVPGVVLVLAVLQLAARARRVVRRRGFVRLPVRALNGRLLPWTATTLLAVAAALWSLLRAGAAAEAQHPSASGVGLLPADPWLHFALLAVVGVGAVAGVVRTGLRFGRGGRIGGDVVLLVYCGAHLATALGDPVGIDRLPAAPALAVVLSEGVIALFGTWKRRRVRGA